MSDPNSDEQNHSTSHRALPSRWDSLLFSLKAGVFQCKRILKNSFIQPVKRYPSHPEWTSASFEEEAILGESITPLWNQELPSEQWLVAGKVHNLRIACRGLNGIEVPAGEIFSFWAHVGMPSRFRGFVDGRELREGCVIPSIGGGLCQLSNALYEAALKAECQILERHAHTEILPGSAAALGRDATVFWNYVDLRFKAQQTLKIRAILEPNALRVTFYGSPVPAEIGHDVGEAPDDLATHLPNSCTTCGMTSCFRNVDMRAENESPKRFGRTAFLVDEYWPEYDDWIQSEKTSDDLICIPMDGRRHNKPNYRWTLEGFGKVEQQWLFTLWRAFRSRKLSQQGAKRQKALLDFDRALAQRYAAKLDSQVTQVVVKQSLLPHLWRLGALGGRSFDVLMTRLPLEALERRLDQAAAEHPDSPTLGDFRADPALLAAEREALLYARRIITPHREIAELFPERAVLLDWRLPTIPTDAERGRTSGHKVAFCGPTLGRKGAYLMREAALSLGLELVIYGQDLEGEDFWQGVSVKRRPRHAAFSADIAVVVQPAYVEHAPRRLLEALALGIPVIASDACGLNGVPGVISIETGEREVLISAIKAIMAPSAASLTL